MDLRLPVEPHPHPGLGDRVRIQDGPLARVEGILVDFRKSTQLVLSVSLLQRSVLLKIDYQRPSRCEAGAKNSDLLQQHTFSQ